MTNLLYEPRDRNQTCSADELCSTTVMFRSKLCRRHHDMQRKHGRTHVIKPTNRTRRKDADGNFLCVECSSKTRVVDSRPVVQGIRRRRLCVNNHRFTTYEVPGIDPDEVKSRVDPSRRKLILERLASLEPLLADLLDELQTK